MDMPSQFIDPKNFPPDEKPHIVDLANKHNMLNIDVDKISGVTAEEKSEAHWAFARLREGWHWVLGKGPGVAIILAVVMYILDHLGVDTKQLAPLITSILQSLLPH